MTVLQRGDFGLLGNGIKPCFLCLGRACLAAEGSGLVGGWTGAVLMAGAGGGKCFHGGHEFGQELEHVLTVAAQPRFWAAVVLLDADSGIGEGYRGVDNAPTRELRISVPNAVGLKAVHSLGPSTAR